MIFLFGLEKLNFTTVLKMQELAKLIMIDVEKADGIAPKTKGQRKRDKWARVQKRMAANAAAAIKSPS